MEHARRKARIQAALCSLADHGCYVFDELPTESAGILDYLVVGPPAICTIIVRTERGVVTPGPAVGSGPGELYLDGRPFPDGPNKQARELTEDLIERLPDTSKSVGSVICFTDADIRWRKGEEHLLEGLCPLWDLAKLLTTEKEELTPADIEEFAEIIERIYGRPPILRPSSGEEHQ